MEVQFWLHCVGCLDLLAVSIVNPLVDVYFSEIGFSPFVTGVYSSSYGFVQLLSSPYVGHLADKHGQISVLFLCLLFSCGGYGFSCLVALNFVSFLGLTRLFLGFFKHTQRLCRNALAELTDESARTKSMSRYNSLTALGVIIGSSISGFFSELKPLKDATVMGFLFCMFVFLLNTVIVFVFIRPYASQNVVSSTNNVKSNSTVISSASTSRSSQITQIRTVKTSKSLQNNFTSVATTSRSLQNSVIQNSKLQLAGKSSINSLQNIITSVASTTKPSLNSIFQNDELQSAGKRSLKIFSQNTFTSVASTSVPSQNSIFQNNELQLGRKSSFIENLEQINWKEHGGLFATQFLLSFSVMLYRSSFILCVKHYHSQLSFTQINYLLSYSNLSVFFVGYYCSWIFSQPVYVNNEEILQLHAIIVLSIAMLILATSNDIYSLFIGLTVMAMATVASKACAIGMVLKRCKSKEIGEMSGLIYSVTSLARLFAPIVAGFVQEYSFAAPPFISLFSLLLTLIIFYFRVYLYPIESHAMID